MEMKNLYLAKSKTYVEEMEIEITPGDALAFLESINRNEDARIPKNVMDALEIAINSYNDLMSFKIKEK